MTKTSVLCFVPELAAVIGLNEAIVLNQIHYWIEKNKENHVNFRDGRTWVFQTYKEWNEQFIFWCDKTIKRLFLRLENQGYITSANYNRIGYDKTKWYTINYESLPFDLRTNCPAVQTDIPDGAGQKVPTERDYVTQPIQENNKDNNKESITPARKEEVSEDDGRVGYGRYRWVRLSDEEALSLLTSYGKDAVFRAIAYVDTSAQQTDNRNGWRDWRLAVERAISENWGGILNGIC